MSVRQSASRWDRIAKLEPYYSVLSHPQFLLSRIRENPAPFFESGEADVARLIDSIRKADAHAEIHNALEIGCGPGRQIPALLRRGIAVTAVDQSPEMLSLARANTAHHGDRVTFVDANAFREDRESRFDLVMAARVLQHIRSSQGSAFVRDIATRVRRGGYLYLDLPFRSTRSALSQTALQLRAHVPLLNSIANVAKNRPRSTPVLPVHLHSLDTIVEALDASAMEIVDVAIRQENELTTAGILAGAHGRRKAHFDQMAVPSKTSELPADYISPRELVRTITLEDLSARAEQYFARMESFETQLSKPFASTVEAPGMLISLGAVLLGMRLVPGMRVLDFGGGTGWLSRALSQFGCRVVLCDVSPTALRVARESNEQHRPIGAKEPMEYLLFGGTRIDLPDASVDRIICFDSFHHVPNPDEIIREFGRILRPGGLAAFSEPGPHHSRSASSQFEMRVHGVLENDVDVRAIWNVAKTAGFDDFRAGVFDGNPPYMTLDELEELLGGGPALQRTAHHLRDFAEDVRTFTLHKRGEETLDSRTTRGLLSRIEIEMAATAKAGEPIPFTATIENIGTAIWLPFSTSHGGVALGAHLYRGDGLVNFDFVSIPVSEEPIAPGARVVVEGTLPLLTRGRYTLDFDLVSRRVIWFEQAGSKPARRTIDIA